MASIQQLKDAACEAGFVISPCAHENPEHHLVLDYPESLREGRVPLGRVIAGLSKAPDVTYIVIVGGDTPSQQVSLVEAIDFMQRLARQNPK